MRTDKFTLKSQEAIARAQEIASELNHQELASEHLLAALLQQKDSIVVPMLQKIGAHPDTLASELKTLLNSIPAIHGDVQRGYLSPKSAKVLEQAMKDSSNLKDEYISTEHILLALTEKNSSVADLLNKHGVNRASIMSALKEIRGSQRVSSMNK